jgi:hypothetical protein
MSNSASRAAFAVASLFLLVVGVFEVFGWDLPCPAVWLILPALAIYLVLGAARLRDHFGGHSGPGEGRHPVA